MQTIHMFSVKFTEHLSLAWTIKYEASGIALNVIESLPLKSGLLQGIHYAVLVNSSPLPAMSSLLHVMIVHVNQWGVC